MLKHLKNRVDSFFKSETNNKKISTYTLFLFISFSFWFLSMLSKQHETTLNVPVKYSNFPTDKIVVGSILDNIQVRVKASGFSIVSYNLFTSSKLELNLEVANTKPNNNGVEVFWIMSSNRKAIAEVLPSAMEIIAVLPVKISIPLKDKAKKKIAVELKEEISLKPELWYASPVALTPDSIIVYGEQNQLDTINTIKTTLLKIVDLTEDERVKVVLTPVEGLEYKQDYIDVSIAVEPFVEEVITQDIKVENLKPGYSIKLFPDQLAVTLRVSKNKYSILKTDFLSVVVDASTISEGNNTLDPKIENLPPFIQLQRIYPSRVEFLLIKE